MNGKLTLTIDIGNDDVRTKRDVARLLREVAKKLEAGNTYGVIMDANGNMVGEFEIEQEGSR